MKTVKRDKGNNWLWGIRKKLGLSQEKMAEQLGIGTTAYKMAEQGRRSLPVQALTQVARFDIKLSNDQPGCEADTPHEAEQQFVSKHRENYERLFARENVCRMHIGRLERRLGSMKGMYKRNREWIRIMEAMIGENPLEHKDTEWWQRQQKTVVRKLQRCSLPAQVLLRARIALLNAEADMYRNMKAQLQRGLPEFF